MALVALVGCRSATCPPGFEQAGDRCAPLDGSVGEGGICRSYLDGDGDGFGNPAQSMVGCPPPFGYVDNGDDCDDSNAQIRPTATEGFDCEQNGVNVPCTTECGSTGVGSCDASCSATACTAPAETCTYADDDCDGQVDEGLQAMTTPAAYSSTSEAARTWTFGGDDPVVFTLYRGGAITARRFDTSGAPVGDEQVIYTVALELELGNLAIDVARAGDRFVFLLPDAEGTTFQARAFAASDFAPAGEPLAVGNSDLRHARITADGDNILIAYSTNNDTFLLATDRSLTPRGSANLVGPGVIPAVVARPGSLDWWLSYSRPSGSGLSVVLQRVRPIGTLVGPAIEVTTAASLLPDLAVTEDGTVGVLHARGQPPTELWLQVRRADGTLVNDLQLPGEWGYCFYPPVPYCRPSWLLWTGSRWLVTRVAPEGAMQATRLQTLAADGSAVLDDVVVHTSADQLRMPSAARLPSGASLITVPTPGQPLYARWGCP
jgi:hypothetical protein